MRCFTMSFVLLLLLLLQGNVVNAQHDNQAVESFMRAKLLHSQKVLEGLATDQLEGVAKHAQEMSLLSLASTWQVIETPEYTRRSSEFRHAVDQLTKAAKAGSLDGATLGYVNVTLKCVECHKYVRRVRQVQRPATFNRQVVGRRQHR